MSTIPESHERPAKRIKRARDSKDSAPPLTSGVPVALNTSEMEANLAYPFPKRMKLMHEPKESASPLATDDPMALNTSARESNSPSQFEDVGLLDPIAWVPAVPGLRASIEPNDLWGDDSMITDPFPHDAIVHPPQPAPGEFEASQPLTTDNASPTGSRSTRRRSRRARDHSTAPVTLQNPFQDYHVSFDKGDIIPKPSNGQLNSFVKFNWRIAPYYHWRLSVATEVTAGGWDSLYDLPRTGEGSLQLFAESEGVSLATPGREASVSALGSPQRLLPSFGMQTTMDNQGRRLWQFFINNFCPGRSILDETNVWLRDIAPMHGLDGISSAIRSLTAVYISDYVRPGSLQERINRELEHGSQRLQQLLHTPMSRSQNADELIAIAIILSMLDVIIWRQRLKRPEEPRWLRGLGLAEQVLTDTDIGSRYWRDTPGHRQVTALRISQTILVGRGIILAQPMSPLPPKSFNVKKELGRFNWLFYGTKESMYEIHGGCGFSKKLLHIISQVTALTGALRDAGDTTWARVAKDVLEECRSLRQWSRATRSWDQVKSEPPLIESVRDKPDYYIISSRSEMTEVTAEAWRLATISYLQCRLLRMPRSHPDVVLNLQDLAHCIRMMPRSGQLFTAQAPLLPVFLLGVLATQPIHKEICQTWMEQVVATPVRSSVPPLYKALQHIWDWIDTEPLTRPVPNETLNPKISSRPPWWEYLVSRVGHNERETLCLT